MGEGLGGGDHPPLNPLPSREGKRVAGQPVYPRPRTARILLWAGINPATTSRKDNSNTKTVHNDLVNSCGTRFCYFGGQLGLGDR
jgi:hypothetical protein